MMSGIKKANLCYFSMHSAFELIAEEFPSGGIGINAPVATAKIRDKVYFARRKLYGILYFVLTLKIGNE